MLWLSVGLFPYIYWLHSVWKLLLLIQFWEIYLNYFIHFGVYFVWCMKLFENVFFSFFMTMKLLFTYSLIFFTCKNSLLFCLCFLLISWMQCLTLLRMSCFSSPLFFDVFFFFSWVALFPSSSFVFCFSLCLLSKGFFFQMFGDSWVSVYLITGLSKSSWKPCVCFLWAFLHSNLARVFHWRVPSWFSNTILHRDESATVPVRYRVVCEHWGKEGWYLTIQ